MKKYWLAKLKRRLTRHRTAVRTGAITILLACLMFVLYATLKPVATFIARLAHGPATAFSLVKDPEGVLRSTRSRTNILLLGMGGAAHEGAQLTDSIIVVSLDLASVDTVLLSIPRDIWIDSLKTKINATYYYGEQQQERGGLLLSKAAVEEVIGQPIHYAVAIDFDGFQRAIDLVEGVEIDVPQSFDDEKYPIPGMEQAEPEELRYEHLHFDAGLQKMNGEKALKYVRSRNAEGEQGTDFARARRQQQVLVAFKNKLLSLDTILSPTKIKELVQTFTGSVRTDMNEAEYLSLAKLAIQTKKENLREDTLSTQDEETGKEGLLIHPSPAAYDGQWVLIGKDDSWDEVKRYVEMLLYE
ncbi:MAG: hypothetical protein A2785_02720 [Candidatus Chisholmbacteria bacterium RIFCSPHIGHO2_01_FULL_49_18]|uniref:Cell envelope-related transcriptional attenuator domain-containing protein n=1 Tax=Candidatus Chisholmbacteria bacterium RIFCSPHIGHO2_01_FULL_49_18 TaxID=1797590 RepID=A0A1G1VKY2_9BACT|nr:MAG: hypothetical protein A2785_02720 [Candidatus Chisholmbacteria bacterium RIFCSPHIGHO2_01_FULL_49_18]